MAEDMPEILTFETPDLEGRAMRAWVATVTSYDGPAVLATTSTPAVLLHVNGESSYLSGAHAAELMRQLRWRCTTSTSAPNVERTRPVAPASAKTTISG